MLFGCRNRTLFKHSPSCRRALWSAGSLLAHVDDIAWRVQKPSLFPASSTSFVERSMFSGSRIMTIPYILCFILTRPCSSCKIWRITPQWWRNCKLQHVQESRHPYLWTTGTNRTIVNQSVAERLIKTSDCQATCRSDDHAAENGSSFAYLNSLHRLLNWRIRSWSLSGGSFIGLRSLAVGLRLLTARLLGGSLDVFLDWKMYPSF